MSLILEALRKSEAERRRGQAPDLHAELPPAGTPPARALPVGWWAAPVAVLAIAALWLVLRTVGPDSAPVATQPAPGITPPVAETIKAPTLPARTPAAPSATTTQPGPAAPDPIVARKPTLPAAGSPPAVAVPIPQAAPQAPAPHAATPPPAATAPSDPGRVLTVGELDAGTRQALPPLRLSMHMWNEDPAQRFVILDGQRVGEGDRIGEASVVRIERDGVLLEWQGRGIRIPVR